MPREKTDVEERWQRGDRGIRDEKEVWGCARRRRRKMERERRAMGCQDSKACLSFCASVSLFPGSDAGTVFAQMRVYIHSHAHTKHTFSHSINASWMLEISLFLSSVTT